MKSLLPFFLFIISLAGNTQNPFDLDTTFRADMDGEVAWYWNYVGDFWLEEDNKIIIVGSFEHYWNKNLPKYCVRLNQDGSLDHSFQYQGPMTDGQTPTRIDKRNGMYYLGYYLQPGMVRMFPNGVVDTNFNFPIDSFFLAEVQVSDLYIYPDGRVLVAGNFWKTPSIDWGLMRLNADGSIDTSFNVTLTNQFVDYIQPLSDGKFLLGGVKSDMAGTRNGLWRIHPDGTLDTGFNTRSVGGAGSNFFRVMPDNKILATGEFNIPGHPKTLKLVRFLPDGAVDSTFNFDIDFETAPLAFLHHGEYLLVTGYIQKINGKQFNCIAAFDTLGNLDTTLFGSLGPDSSLFYYNKVLARMIMQDNKILLHGTYTSFMGLPSLNLVRLYGISVGINETEEQESLIRVYPNPASESVRIDFNSSFLGDIVVYDISGRKIFNKHFPSTIHSYTFPVNRLAPGIYIIEAAMHNGFASSMKLVVE